LAATIAGWPNHEGLIVMGGEPQKPAPPHGATPCPLRLSLLQPFADKIIQTITLELK
jgi:hypothetical protein